ncbi:contractile injection system protein, VgrG/Pvc8 family [Lacrimispora sp.]|uniref:contractile injection system protein, VgrG/Pvc8 family n=1 Tax=Lacrimispora sp. TaxID=2719234 RepID=UPI0039910C52
MDYTFKELTISAEIELASIFELKMSEEINQHSCLMLKGICQEGHFDQVVAQLDSERKITVRSQNGNLLFCGLITDLMIDEKIQVGTITLKANSFTCQMDYKKRKRVFQNLDMTYCEIISKILEPYNKASFVDKVTENRKIPHIIIQYDETDWEFMRRLASHFQDGIYPDMSSETIQFSVGRPLHEKVHTLNQQPELMKTNLINRQETNWIDSYEKYEIGDTVTNQGRTYFIQSVDMVTNHEEIRYFIKLVSNREEKFTYIPNNRIAHKREWAFVADIKRNKLKLQFPMEEVTGANSPLFPFEGEQNNQIGYYMSDIGTRVIVYFPDEEEQNAVVLSAMREGAGVPVSGFPSGMQFMKNEEGNELCMDKKSLRFLTGKKNASLKFFPDGIIQLNAADSMSVSSAGCIQMGAGLKHLKMRAEKGIQLKAGKTGNNVVEIDESGNVECRCSGNVMYKKQGSQNNKGSLQAGIAGSASGSRDVTLALAGTEFVSRAVTGNMDFRAAGKILSQLTGGASSVSLGNDSQLDDNLIKSGLFQNSNALFDSFSYGENKNGKKK